jgi:hypothetical protein
MLAESIHGRGFEVVQCDLEGWHLAELVSLGCVAMLP